jgi:hypothetical protein
LATPEDATALLALNTRNRPLSRSQVEMHKKRLLAGTFVLTPDAIAFDTNGALIEGQHRLTAVAESGVAALFFVAVGLPPDTFLALGQGKLRSTSDNLALKGHKNAHLRAAITSVLMHMAGKRTIDKQEVIAYEADLDDEIMLEAIKFAMRMNASYACPYTAASGAAYYWIQDHAPVPMDKTKWEGFTEGLISGAGISGAVLKLREWLKDNKADATVPYVRNQQRVKMIVAGWNIYAAGRGKFSLTAREVDLQEVV